jgi:hypothetical protein
MRPRSAAKAEQIGKKTTRRATVTLMGGDFSPTRYNCAATIQLLTKPYDLLVA